MELAGIDPDRVFKFRSAGLLADSSLRGEGLEVLGENIEWTYFVLMDGAARITLDATLDAYAATSDLVAFPGTKSLQNTISMIETIEPYGPDDRLDPRLAESTNDPVEVNIRIWPSATTAEARQRIGIVNNVVETDPQRSAVLADDDDPEATIVVASLSRDALNLIAQTSVVERVTPPVSMTITPTNVAAWALPDEQVPHPSGAPIGVVDDGLLEGNPLLDAVIQAEASFPPDRLWNPPSGHGIAVSSLAAYFDFEDVIRANQPLRDPHPILLARIVEPDADRPDEVRSPPGTVYERSIEEAIRWLNNNGRVSSISACAQSTPRNRAYCPAR